MHLDRLLTDEKPLSNLSVSESLSEQVKNLVFTIR